MCATWVDGPLILLRLLVSAVMLLLLHPPGGITLSGISNHNARASRRELVRVAGFEPATVCSQSRCSTKLSYTLKLDGVSGFEPENADIKDRCRNHLAIPQLFGVSGWIRTTMWDNRFTVCRFQPFSHTHIFGGGMGNRTPLSRINSPSLHRLAIPPYFKVSLSIKSLSAYHRPGPLVSFKEYFKICPRKWGLLRVL